MCYNISYLTKKKLDYARRFGELADVTELEKTLTELYRKAGPNYYATGFDHPDVPVMMNNPECGIRLITWGLIPFWVKNPKQAVELSNRTLNARGEEMFEKSSFRLPSRKRRCLVIVDGFFEYHWKNDRSYPYYISLKSGEPMTLGGLWDHWEYKEGDISRDTFSIVTTKANSLMEYIHNRPKASEGPRMPVIIPKGSERDWLHVKAGTDDDIRTIKDMLRPFNENDLEYHTVGKLKGRGGAGNTPGAIIKVDYPELG